MTKRFLNALERVWIAEIENRLPFQSDAKVFRELEAEGLIHRVIMTMGGRFEVKVHGWELSHAGRLAYCISIPTDMPT